ncbi:MAG: CotH kinase family protein [Bacteroidales bacterium]|nr:CotH kinase family protein [Bacteroidales bacterium]
MNRTWWILLFLLSPVALCHGQAVVFSHEGGFYADTFSLAMQTLYAPDGEPFSIHYTLNGNTPTECDALYERPLPLGRECYSPSKLFRVPTVPAERWFAPEEVERIIVVRAAAFDSAGLRRSPVTTHSYLIDSLLGRRISLPVVSLCADSLSLFDSDTGLMVPGWYFDERYPYSTGNYFQRGRAWERTAAMAYYAPDGTSTGQDCGLRVHGNSQRVLAQKGLSLYARREYGGRRFDYPFFGDGRPSGYSRLVLRPWATSWSGAGIEDWLCQQLAEPLRFDHLATRPVTLFLNGEYWGIYFLEEKADEHYVEEHYGLPHEEVDLLAYWGGEVENGTAQRWNTFAEWMLTDGTDLDRMAAQVDTGGVMDYMLMQCLILNDDWLVSNVRQWAVGNGPWHWLFFDADGALSSFPDNAAILDYMTYNASGPSSHTSPQATLLFRRLLANRSFLEASMVRMHEIVDTHFDYSRTGALLQAIVSEVESEVPSQIRRFDKPTSMLRWRMALEVIDDFLRTEPQAMVNEYAQYFGLAMPDDEEDCTVYDPCGRLVASGHSVPVRASLTKGVYFVRLRGNKVAKWTVE